MLSYDASTAADLEPAAHVLAELTDRAHSSDVDIMVVGAAARDILITHVLKIAPDRATADLDIAVSVESWPDLHRLTGSWRSARNSVHTFLVAGVEVDVIPFGGVEAEDRSITWPNDHKMDVLGFREAMTTAIEVSLPLGVRVPVASLPAQSVLKLLAWRDRRYLNRKDAIDLRSILAAYSQGAYLDELYEEAVDLLEKNDFIPATAGAERLGVEARSLIDEADHNHVSSLLTGDMFEFLVGDMGGFLTANREALAAYRTGFLSGA
jgi:predicted nucleotidyltransferase